MFIYRVATLSVAYKNEDSRSKEKQAWVTVSFSSFPQIQSKWEVTIFTIKNWLRQA